jgi:hypothetical protein
MANSITKTAGGFTLQLDGWAAPLSFDDDVSVQMSAGGKIVGLNIEGTIYHIDLDKGVTVNGAPFTGTAAQLRDKLAGEVFASVSNTDTGNFPTKSVPAALKVWNAQATALKTAAGTWKATYCGTGFDLFWDSATQRYCLIYTGYDGATTTKFGIATSDDLLTWTDYGSNPVFGNNATPGQPDSGGITYPQVYQEGGTLYVFYIGFPNAGYEQGTPQICYATLPAGADITNAANWTRHGAVLSPAAVAAATGDTVTVIYRPNVSKVAGTYYMFFNGGALAGAEDIYYATAPAITGPWTVGAKVVQASDYGSAIVSDPQLVRLGDTYVLFLWSGSGTYLAYADASEFPHTFHPVNTRLIDNAIRPLFVDTPDGPLMFVNGNDATTIDVYRPSVKPAYAPPALKPAGRYHRPQGVVSVGTGSLGAGYKTLIPMKIDKATTLKSLSVNCTAAAAGSTVRLGVYSDDGGGKPSALLLDAGTVDTTTTGIKTTGVLSLLLAPGLYWLCANANGGGPTLTTIASMGNGVANSGTLSEAFGALFGWYGGPSFTGALSNPVGNISAAANPVPLVVAGF